MCTDTAFCQAKSLSCMYNVSLSLSGSPMRMVSQGMNVNSTILLSIATPYSQGVLGNQLEGRLNNALVFHIYCRTKTNDWETM